MNDAAAADGPILRPDHRAADVVLMRNDADEGFAPILTALIMKLDKSPFSHSGLMIGPDELSHIGRKGSELTTLSQRTSPTSSYGLVVSLRPDDLDDDTAEQVVAEGRRLGEAKIEYSEVQMVLAGFMLRYRAVPWYLRWTIPVVLPVLAEIINRKIDEDGELMICSDYVYRCFDVAGHELLPGGLPELVGGDELTVDDWLATFPELPDDTGDAPSTVPDGDLDAASVAERLRAADPFDVLGAPAVDAGPGRDEPAAGDADAHLAGDPIAVRTAVADFDRAISAAHGPSPTGIAASQFITPGDLWRSERLAEHARWTQTPH